SSTATRAIFRARRRIFCALPGYTRGVSSNNPLKEDAMTNQSETFGRLLRGAINSIPAYEGKAPAAAQDKPGPADGLSGASIQRYKNGSLPPEPRTVQLLAEAAVRRGYLGRAWLTRFLQAARYPAPDALLAQLVEAPAATTDLPGGTLIFLFT